MVFRQPRTVLLEKESKLNQLIGEKLSNYISFITHQHVVFFFEENYQYCILVWTILEGDQFNVSYTQPPASDFRHHEGISFISGRYFINSGFKEISHKEECWKATLDLCNIGLI